MAPKKKISRKELLKKPDEFITTSNKIYNWISENLRKVILGLLAVVLATGAVLGFLGYRSYRESQAQQKYYSALEQPDPTNKIKALKEITADFPSTKAAGKAWVSLGHLYFQQKDFVQAVQAYQTALPRGDFSGEIQSLIKEDLGYTLEEKGDLKEAAEYFSGIINGPDPLLKESAHLSLARIYLKMGQTKEAKTTFQNFLKAYPNSNYAPIVRDRLARL